MVESRTKMRVIRGCGGNHHDELGLKRILCASQFRIPDTAGTSSDPACNYTETRSAQLNQASRTPISPICLYPPHHPHLHPPSLCFSSTTQPSSQKTKLSDPSQSLHAMIVSWHRVQHTPSTAYTEYSIHRVQHPPKIVCLPFILMIRMWPLNVASASGVPPYTIDCHQPALHGSSKVKSHCHIPTVVS